MKKTTRTVPVRMSDELYEAARELARERGESMNSVIVAGLANQIRERERQILYESFTLLGQDAAESDVEFAFPAQREAAGD